MFIPDIFPILGAGFHELFSRFPTINLAFGIMSIIEKAVKARIDRLTKKLESRCPKKRLLAIPCQHGKCDFNLVF
ncbi:hypothetical protein CAEBREN_15262 [Caenorhabditis brenneri]|uniref:Uncharacterized protein n=1 Tax=Caenorhabditis brenneri TaxID=135651 RepID=G0MN69_CAEBE|nr:hypothetical protein CAEBREN_15262 [Caenorhabditis brenneri]